jgi:hypothetical protein
MQRLAEMQGSLVAQHSIASFDQSSLLHRLLDALIGMHEQNAMRASQQQGQQPAGGIPAECRVVLASVFLTLLHNLGPVGFLPGVVASAWQHAASRLASSGW